MLLRKQVGAGTPRGLQAQVLRAMLLVFGLVNASKLADRGGLGLGVANDFELVPRTFELL